MERAIHITNLKNIKYFYEGEYQRVYWGAEFCQNLIPALREFKEIFKFINKNNLEFTVITPFVTEDGLKKLKKIFAWLKQRRIRVEIIVNDWGVLEYLNTHFNGVFDLSLGRLLARQQRDPTITNVFEKQPLFAIKGSDGKIHVIIHRPPAKIYREGIKSSYLNSYSTQRFLSKFGIGRVELNNLAQGVNIENIKFKKSIYTPYVNISTTRFCPMDSVHQKRYRINVCKKECQKYYDILRNRTISKPIFKRGNTTFYTNPLDMKWRLNNDIDRIVFQPELPF